MVPLHMHMKSVLRLEHHVALEALVGARVVLVLYMVDNVVLSSTDL